MRKRMLILCAVLVFTSLFSGASARSQGTPTPTPGMVATSTALPMVTSNRQWTPVVQRFNGVEMVLVPPGCFLMGSTPEQVAPLNKIGSNNWFDQELPQTKICFSLPFWIDKTEVTQAQFRQFGGITAGWRNPIGDSLPINKLTWFEAYAFCVNRGARLPTEAEWEYAARGPDDLVYTWGNEFDPRKLAWAETLGTDIVPVGSLPDGASWVGAMDMIGNVWEWVNSIYKPYPYSALDGRESTSDMLSTRVMRGGSGENNRIELLRTANRLPESPSLWNSIGGTGVRCARSD